MGNKDNITIVISCAGRGTRLGKGITKALLDIEGEKLIIRQLKLLDNYEDIRIVVGYQADEVIEVVKQYRTDITFLYNNDYLTTGTAASFSKGLENSREYIVAFDGDLLVNPEEIDAFLQYPGECIGGCIPTTDNPVLMTISKDEKVTAFSRESGELEWTGLAKIKADKLVPGEKHVYMMLEPILPIDVFRISTKEIDTENDLNNAISWINNNYMD